MRDSDYTKYFQGWGSRKNAVSAPEACNSPAKSSVSGVCNNCGAALSKHNKTVSEQRALPYAEAVWGWLLENGAYHSYYGSIDQGKTVEFLVHVESCGLDYDKSGLPESHQLDEFNGTFTDTQLKIDWFGAVPVCNCDEYTNNGWYGSDVFGTEQPYTLGEIIFQIVTFGEKGAKST